MTALRAVTAVADLGDRDLEVVPARALPTWQTQPRLQTRLQQRRPIAVRRHALRFAARLGVILAADAAALALVIVLVDAARDLASTVGALGALLLHGTPAILGGGNGVPVLVATMGGLLLSGGYGRRPGWQGSAVLVRGCALGVAVVAWRPLLEQASLATAGAVAAGLAMLSLAVIGGRQVARRFLAGVWPGTRGAPRAVVVDPRDEAPVAEALTSLSADYQFVGSVAAGRVGRADALGRLDDLAAIIDREGVETVVVAGPLDPHQLAAVLDVSQTAGCELLYPAREIRLAGVRPRVVWRGDEAFLELGAPVLKAQQLLVKRVVDVAGATLGLVLLAPLLTVLAGLVKLDSPGPALFVQHRAGLGGRRFRMYKFRTMRTGADEEKGTLSHLNHSGDRRLFKIPDDPRVTRFGTLLRRWSLDELPQLWNVLVGDMSLVGPRPFFESDLEDYEAHHFRRLGAKPGITGLWQVNGRSAVVDFEEVVRYDREYIERWSLWLDVRILASTLPAVLRRTGAY